MKIIFIGDIHGKIGRRAVAAIVPKWREKYKPDFVIGNGENLAHGSGITQKTLREVMDAGLDALTGGNHSLEKPEGRDLLNDPTLPLLRPANLVGENPGRGDLVIADKASDALRLLLINLMGRVFFEKEGKTTPADPFRALDQILEKHRDQKYSGILVDFHAEATSEKTALGHYADGRVSAVLGTHTHIGTIDAHILEKGTAYVTDVGAVIAVDSVIGEKKEMIVESFLTDHLKHEPVEKGLCQISAVLLDINEATGRARTISRIDEQVTI